MKRIKKMLKFFLERVIKGGLLAQLPQLSKKIEVFLDEPTTETLYLREFFFFVL